MAGLRPPRTGRTQSAAACVGLMVAARQRPDCSRATRAGTDVRAAPARAAGSRATHRDSADGSPPERRARIQCVRGVARRGRPPEGSACARSMRADGSRRAGSGTWRASGFEPGAQPTSAGSSRSCRSRLHSITSALLSNGYASPVGAAEDPAGRSRGRLRKRDEGKRFLVSAFAITARPQEALSARQNDDRSPRLDAPTIARNPPPLPGRGTPCSAFGCRRSRCTEPSIWWCRSTPAASLSSQSKTITPAVPAQRLASAPPRNPGDECSPSPQSGDECRAFYLTRGADRPAAQRFSPGRRCERPVTSVGGRIPDADVFLGGVVPVMEPIQGTPWAVSPDPRPVVGVVGIIAKLVGITANRRDPADAKRARAAALLAVQQYHPSSRPESLQMQAKSSRGRR